MRKSFAKDNKVAPAPEVAAPSHIPPKPKLNNADLAPKSPSPAPLPDEPKKISLPDHIAKSLSLFTKRKPAPPVRRRPHQHHHKRVRRKITEEERKEKKSLQAEMARYLFPGERPTLNNVLYGMGRRHPIEVDFDYDVPLETYDLVDDVEYFLIFHFLLVAFVLIGCNYMYMFMSDSFVRQILFEEVYQPTRYVASIWEYVFLSVFLECLAITIKLFPKPSVWQIGNWKCPRYLRWLVCFLFYAYHSAIFGLWVYFMPGVSTYMSDTIKHRLETEFWKRGKAFDITTWNVTQVIFTCCGINSHKDWDKRMEKTHEDLFDGAKYHLSCCDRKKSSCIYHFDTYKTFPHYTIGCFDLLLKRSFDVICFNVVLGCLMHLTTFAIVYKLCRIESIMADVPRRHAERRRYPFWEW